MSDLQPLKVKTTTSALEIREELARLSTWEPWERLDTWRRFLTMRKELLDSICQEMADSGVEDWSHVDNRIQMEALFIERAPLHWVSRGDQCYLRGKWLDNKGIVGWMVRGYWNSNKHRWIDAGNPGFIEPWNIASSSSFDTAADKSLPDVLLSGKAFPVPLPTASPPSGASRTEIDGQPPVVGKAGKEWMDVIMHKEKE